MADASIHLLHEECGNTMTLAAASKLCVPIVYGLCAGGGEPIVYVGRTINPSRRFYSYRHPDSCHNPQLAEWLRAVGDTVRIVVLSRDAESLDREERLWIRRLKDQLFNLVAGGDQAWRNHESMPWMAGTGIGCPSAIVLQHLKRAGSGAVTESMEEQIQRARSGMTVSERCLFEIDICRDILLTKFRFREAGERWLSITSEKMISALEVNQCAEAKQIHTEAR